MVKGGYSIIDFGGIKAIPDYSEAKNRADGYVPMYNGTVKGIYSAIQTAMDSRKRIVVSGIYIEDTSYKYEIDEEVYPVFSKCYGVCYIFDLKSYIYPGHVRVHVNERDMVTIEAVPSLEVDNYIPLTFFIPDISTFTQDTQDIVIRTNCLREDIEPCTHTLNSIIRLSCSIHECEETGSLSYATLIIFINQLVVENSILMFSATLPSDKSEHTFQLKVNPTSVTLKKIS